MVDAQYTQRAALKGGASSETTQKLQRRRRWRAPALDERRQAQHLHSRMSFPFDTKTFMNVHYLHAFVDAAFGNDTTERSR
jgi:hypothetical protein